MNIFRALGDASHIIAFTILLYKLWKTKSCSGISGKSQILFAIVYTARYLDLATIFFSMYNTAMKAMFLTVSYSIIYLIYVKFKATYNYKHDTFYNEFLILPAMTLALLFNYASNVMEIMWTFSTYLESVAILPQLFLAVKTKEADSFTLHYLLALSSYRGFYIVNWMYRYQVEGHYDMIAVVSGIVQITIYLLYFIYRYIFKDCCSSGQQSTIRNQGYLDNIMQVQPLQSDHIVALHLGLSKGQSNSIQQDSKMLVV